MSKIFTGTEFVKMLSEGGLREPIVLEGIVKSIENDPNALLFAEGMSCPSWTTIPAEMIDKVDYITTIPCRDHEHPLVLLYLKEPPPENKEAGVLANLLRAGRGVDQAEVMVRGRYDRICAALQRCCDRGNEYCCERLALYGCS